MEAMHFLDNWRKDLHVSQGASDRSVDMDRLNRNAPADGVRQTHQMLHSTPLDLIETGKGLKFQAERPHLVSLGSGRLSTAITLLPLPEGCTTLGHGPTDINIQGPGVAPQHCYIENRCGVITLHPCGNLCSIDGLQIKQPSRLRQVGEQSAVGLRAPQCASLRGLSRQWSSGTQTARAAPREQQQREHAVPIRRGSVLSYSRFRERSGQRHVAPPRGGGAHGVRVHAPLLTLHAVFGPVHLLSLQPS
ncbi:hypothetical protein OJAV_G00126310 [Oryzias javanicus]|uniref:FHA domain-containing protein n=1 Tax=Oryzias javanicus TaxID=123683 RepID=A0A3S2PE87_ORYJA|nr:hypothetical protein OJAV_G00126310 [Oryzias javanicus]